MGSDSDGSEKEDHLTSDVPERANHLVDNSLPRIEEEDADLTVDDGGEDYADDDMDIAEIKSHPSYEQVLLDVNRCAGRLEHIRQCYLHRTDEDGDDEPPEDLSNEFEDSQEKSSDRCDRTERLESSSSVSDENDDKTQAETNERRRDLEYQRKLKRKLAKLILRLLMRKPQLHYYQGFHDVCLTYMTIYGDKEALARLDSVIDSHFSAFMQPTMLETQEFLALIPIIIGLQDSGLRDFLEKAEVGTIFALSWVITWFSHVIPNERDVETIYEHLERVQDPHLILYLCAAIVLYKRNQILELEPEMSTVHKYLSQTPRKQKLPIDDLLADASWAFKKWPPDYVKKQLSRHRLAKLQVHNYNVVSSLAQRFVPNLASMITTSPKTAIIVFVIASAFALQFDRWVR